MFRKTMLLFIVFLVSGLLPTAAALAAELVATATAEFVAEVENGHVIVEQGSENDFKINLSVVNDKDGSNANATFTVDTKYVINANQHSTTAPSQPISFNGNNTTGETKATISVSNNAKLGEHLIPIRVNITSNHNQNKLNNTVPDYIKVKVIPSDTVEPVVTINNPSNNGFYKSSALPEKPEFTVADDSSYTTMISGYSTDNGTHTVTVTATDAFGNVGKASVTYTVDNQAPVITSPLVDGGVYNSEYLSSFEDGIYYEIDEPHLLDYSAASLVFDKEGSQTVEINARDKAGNEAKKSITYIVDNEVPSISFKFNHQGFYTSAEFAKFNPYYEIDDDNLDTKSIEADEASLLEEIHSVTVSATDLAGNSNSGSASYTIDNTAPSVTIHLEDDKYYNEQTLSAVGEFYSVTDINLESVVPSGFETADGEHNASVTATDKADNKTTRTVTYHVDTLAPVITIDAEKFANGGFYTASYLNSLTNFFTIVELNLDEDSVSVSPFNSGEGTHTFNVNAIDKAGNPASTSIRYTVDNTKPEIEFNLVNNGFYKSENLPEEYFTTSDNNEVVSVVADELETSEGTHTLTVTAMDAAGNSTTEAITYTVDDTAPEVTITAPEDGRFYKSEDLPENVVFDVEEEHDYTTNVIGWNNYAEIEHTVTVTATDVAGNIGQASVTYTVDNTEPVITSTLVDGGVYNAETLEGLGQYYNVTDLNLVEDSVSASELQLEEGTYKAVITAVDKAGNDARKEINYTVDNTVPEILFTFEDEGHYTLEAFEEFNPYYEVDDDNLIEDSIEVQGLNFVEGEHTLTVSASDLAGNENEQSATYTIDDTKPEVTVTLEEGNYYNLEALEALGQYWTATDDNLYDVDATPLATTDGPHTATVTAIDKAGNETSVSVQYHIDNTPPEIIIDQGKIKDGGFYNADYLRSLSNVYRINDANPASDNATPFVLTEGTHDYTVTATDKAGNTNSLTISYTVDNTPPTLTFNLVANGVYNSQSLNTIGAYFTVTDNHHEFILEADDLVTNGDGTYKLDVIATDLAGNETTGSITYTLDNTAPEVTFNLENGKHYTSEAFNKALDGHKHYYKATDKHSVTVEADELETSEGTHTLEVTATDVAGNSTTESITYTIDNTSPVINGVNGLKDGQRFLVGQRVSLTPDVTEDNPESVTFAEELDTSKTGVHSYTVTATDKAGNSATRSFTYQVYEYSGVLQPINQNGNSTFKRNSTIPVKFQIADGTKNVSDAKSTLHLVHVGSGSNSEPVEVTSTSAASTGNEFRYDAKDNQYIFNLSTKNLEEGQYRAVITIELDGVKTIKESQTFSIRR